MSTANLRNFISDNIEIFSLPTIVIKLNSLLQDPDVNLNEIADLVLLDAGLTAQLLRIVNSSYYNLSKPVDTVTNAISIIGVNDLYELVLATKVIKKFDKIPTKLISPKIFWQHNIACAIASKVIAREFKIANPERFFILGLLHDIGKLVMYISQPDLCSHILTLIDKSTQGIDEIEKIAFGFSHDEVGSELLKNWGVPESVFMPILYHHHPAEAHKYQFETAILHLANSIANLIEQPISFDDALPVKTEVWNILNVDSHTLIPLTNSTENHYRDVVALMMGDMAA